LNRAGAAVLLVSPAFLASEYIRNNELPVLLYRAKTQGLRIVAVILRPCLFVETRFKYPDPETGPDEFSLASLQAAGSPAKALNEMREGKRDRALLSVAQCLKQWVDRTNAAPSEALASAAASAMAEPWTEFRVRLAAGDAMPELDEETRQALLRHAPATIEEYRLARIAEWSQPRYELYKRFTPPDPLAGPRAGGPGRPLAGPVPAPTVRRSPGRAEGNGWYGGGIAGPSRLRQEHTASPAGTGGAYDLVVAGREPCIMLTQRALLRSQSFHDGGRPARRQPTPRGARRSAGR
jgi:hypothetical protein